MSWAAPAGAGPHAVGRGFGSVPSGDEGLARLAARTGARGGLFAWPRTQALRPTRADGALLAKGTVAPDLRLVVPPLAGAVTTRADGARVAPGPVLLRAGPHGMALEGAP